MRRLLLYVLVIAGGVFIASCMGPKSVEQWMDELGIVVSDPLPPSSIDWDIRYSGTNAAGDRRTHRDNEDGRVQKNIETVDTASADFPAFYAAEVGDRDTGKIHENVFSQWAGEAYGLARTAEFKGLPMELKRIRIDKPYFGENLSLSETLIMAVYEPLAPSRKDAAAYRLASADPDPSVILALMMARVDDYECIWCGTRKVCAVNPVCP